MMNTQIDLVFRPDLGDDDIVAATASAANVLGDTSGKPIEESPPQRLGEAITYRRWTQRQVPPVAIDLTIDRSIPVAMLSVVGSDQDATIAAAQVLWDCLANGENALLCTPEELVSMALASAADPAALVRAAIPLKHDYHEQLQPRFARLLASPEASDRAYAAKAAALAAWRELLPLIDDALSREADQGIRQLLQVARMKCAQA